MLRVPVDCFLPDHHFVRPTEPVEFPPALKRPKFAPWTIQIISIHNFPTSTIMRPLLLVALLLGSALLAAAHPRLKSYGNGAEARAAAAELKALVSQSLGDGAGRMRRSAAWPLPSVHRGWVTRASFAPVVQRPGQLAPHVRLPSSHSAAAVAATPAGPANRATCLTLPPAPSPCSLLLTVGPCSSPGRPRMARSMRMAPRR